MNTDREPTRTRLGRLLGASLGPGDPGLITRAAWEALSNADGWAWPVSGSGPSHALEIARRAGLEPPARSLALLFPMTRDAAVLEHAWTEAATAVATRLQSGADLAFLVEGDASTHSTFGHLARALRALEPEARIEVIAGVPSFVAAAAASGSTLADGDETIAICAAPRAMRELDAWLARADSLVLLKVRPVLDALIDALAARGLLDQAMFIDRLGTPQERIVTDLASLRGEPVHYLSLVLIRRDHGRGLGRARDAPASDPRRPMIASEKAPGSAPDVAMEGARKSAAERTPKEAQEEAPEDAPGMASGTPAETLIVALTEPGARLAAHLAGRLVAPPGGFAPGAVVPPALRADLDAGPGSERRASPLAHSPHGEDQARVRVRVPEHLRQVAHAGLSEAPDRIRLDTHDGPLAAPVARFFEHARRADAPCRLIFIGAAGLIVRLIAPHLRDKRSDPAVLVVDEASSFVVPLLAGHLGGANAFGRRLAGLLGAQLVLTTASDVQGTIAVDILGRELGWRVEADAPALLRASSCVVNARPVVLIEEACGREWWTGPGAPPANIRCRPSLEAALAQGLEDACAVLWVTHRAVAADLAARLGERLVVYRPPPMAAADSRSEPRPGSGSPVDTVAARSSARAGGGDDRGGPGADAGAAASGLAVAVGVGCDRGASLETVADCVDAALRQLDAPRVLRLASIAQKRDEPAIQALAATRGWPLHIYPAAELARIPVANPSETVRRILGTPGVAEAAALCAAGAKTGAETGAEVDAQIDAKTGAGAKATTGTDMAALLIEKQIHRGADGKHATVAIARAMIARIG